MKKTIIAVACAAFISTGAMAKPTSHNAPKSNNGHTVHIVNKTTPRPAPHVNNKPVQHHASHHRPAPVVAHVRPTPPPPAHHHHHHDSGAILLGDALIAFAILASNAM